MEENNKFETNADSSGSEGMLYGTEPHPQEKGSGYSAVYGGEPQNTALVQLAKPTETVSEPQSTVPIQQIKSAEIVSELQSTVPVQLAKPTDSVSQLQGQFYPQGNGQPNYNNQPINGSQPNYNNQPMNGGYGPIQVPPPVQGAPSPKPKKGKASIVVGVLCAAAVVLVIAAGVLIAKSFLGGDPRQQLVKGFANMAKEMIAYQSPLTRDIGPEELSQLKNTKPIHTNFDLSFTDPSASGYFTNIDIEVDAVLDYMQKMAAFRLGAGTYGFSMDIGELVAADNTLYVSAPMLFKEVYSLELTNLGRDFNQSVWSDLLGQTLPEDYSLTLFSDIEQSVDSEQSVEKDALQKIFSRKNGISEDAVQYEIIKQKKESTNGGVRVTINKDAYNKAMEAMRDEFLASDYYANLVKGYAMSYAEDFDEFEEYMEEVVETVFSLRFEQDFVLDFYLDKKGRIVNISTPEDIAVSSVYTELDFLAVDIDFTGTERTLDSIEGGIYMQSGDEIVYMGVSRTTDITADGYHEDLTLCMESDRDDEQITFRYKNDWGYSDRTFNMEMILEVPDSSIEISADGSFTDIVRGEGYTLRIDHSAVTVDDEDLLLMTGTVMTEPADDVIEVPDDALNILDMSKSDIIKLLYGYSSLY